MPIKPVLIVGGAGYIGSHMVKQLHYSGYLPVVLDNLSSGHRDAVLGAKLIIGDIADDKVLNELFAAYDFLAVIHFASFIQVAESMQHPEKYYFNNVAGTLNLLNIMHHWKVKKIIFSSTAAVYGEPRYTPTDEAHPLNPLNPYGHSKRMVEQILEDFARAHDFQFAILRYFNAAGADPEGKLAERHHPESHLIPLMLHVAAGKKATIHVFGRDYPTADGTCIRDYVHVTDLCSAHVLALDALLAGKKNFIYNLGAGQGHSVQEVIDIVQRVTQRKITVVDSARRRGDSAILVADIQRAKQELCWQPSYSDLETIVRHAWQAFAINETC